MGALAIPYLSGATLLDFGRRDSDYRVRDFVLNIGEQQTLPVRTYSQMEQLVRVDLPITREQFTRMWRTLILKRVQDVYEHEKHQRAEHFIRLVRNILVPAPLADLLYSIGQMHSSARGFVYDTIPPPRPANPPDWTIIDPAIVANWTLTMNRMKHQFMMKEFPAMRDYQNKPLCLVRIHDANDMREVKAYTNEPQPSDALIAMVNDRLYQDAHNVTYNECSLRMTDSLDRLSICCEYVGSYVLSSTS